METLDKLRILAEAARYDASCASSGSEKRHSAGRPGTIGSTEGMGVCHAYAPDGRCLSLLKILLTNACRYDCLYCINRRSSNVPRARFSPDEVVRLVLDFYKRNYIEGLFLSSGIVGSPDRTMEDLVEVARSLREDHGFLGYIHLKAIPAADLDLLAAAGRHADRVSVNVELPTQAGLDRLAPEKALPSIRKAMGRMRLGIEAAKAEPRGPRFAPAGQSTQMIVGADGANDREILAASAGLYRGYDLRRVYYSAFSPIPGAGAALPAKPAPLQREHRLYQADWLFRFYGFGMEEIATGTDGMLDLAVDPKLAWALGHREQFPVDVNRAAREQLLRVPGLGVRTVERILAARRHARLRLGDLARLRVPLARARTFLVTADHVPAARLIEAADLKARLTRAPRQFDLFG